MVMIVLFHVYLVATQIEIGVMQVIVERVAVTMEAMSHDYHVTYWGCKVFAHAASNGEKMTLCRDCYVALCTCIYMCIYVHSSPVFIKNFVPRLFLCTLPPLCNYVRRLHAKKQLVRLL